MPKSQISLRTWRERKREREREGGAREAGERERERQRKLDRALRAHTTRANDV